MPLIHGAAVLSDPVTALARRQPQSWSCEREARSSYTLQAYSGDASGARDMLPLQHKWDKYLQSLAELCDKKFWKLFLAMHTLSGVAIDRALRVVKELYVTKQEHKQHPSTRRQLFDNIRQLRPFWTHVSHTARIDVSHFNLPSGTTHIVFKFIDPIWGWLMAARCQHPLEMHWIPAAQRRGHEVYGGGIQFGKFFQHVCKSLPDGALPMCIGLHWDGTGARGISSSPISVCVGNTNSSKIDTQFCVGYMPHVPDERRPEWNKQSCATEVKFYLRKKCAAAILKVLETGAARGVKCRLLNQFNNEVTLLLYPRLSSMNFDQPEAQLFFGLQNKTSCSKCRRRKGYSAFRVCKRHKGEDIRRLYCIANDDQHEHRNLAREKLHRWGFNYARECCLHSVSDKLLVRLPGEDEVFPCVDYRDRMHGLIIFLHRMLFTVLDKIVVTQAHRRVLDRRLQEVCRRRFRNEEGYVRGQKSVFTDVGMTATDKAIVIFLLSHVIGPAPGEIFDMRVYFPLATAIANAQLILIAVRGRRNYSLAELDTIFNKGYVVMFGALESVESIVYRKRLQEWSQSSNANPPKRFKRQSRSEVLVTTMHNSISDCDWSVVTQSEIELCRCYT